MESDLGKVDGSAVAVVKSNAVKHPCRVGDVALHVIPQVRTVARTAAVTQLHVVTPRNQLTTQVDVGTYIHTPGKVLRPTRHKIAHFGDALQENLLAL